MTGIRTGRAYQPPLIFACHAPTCAGMEQQWTAIILAGQRPGTDPLAEAFGGEWKALVPVHGLPMLGRVAATLCAVPEIARIVVLAQDLEVMRPALPSDPRIHLVTSGRGISDSIAAIAGTEEAPWPVFVTTADHPLLTPEIIRYFLNHASAGDVAVGMVERQTVLARFPDNKRTWRHFRGGAYSGANLFALNNAKSGPALSLWAEAEQDRKKQLGLLLHFGLGLALRGITRTITLEDGLHKAGDRLGLDARAVILPFAEAAVDVDKVSDHELVEAIMAGKA